jgi:hypothetical protein
MTIATALAGCIVLPWTFRNYEVLGRFVPVKSDLAYELYQSQCLQPDGLVQQRTLSSHPFANPGAERAEYRQKCEADYLDGKWEHFCQSVADDPLELANRIAFRFLGATVLYVPFNRDAEPKERLWLFFLSRLLFPLPFAAFLLLLVAGAAGRLQDAQWMVMGIYGLFLTPYIAISYHDRNAVPLLAVKTLLVIWALALLCSIWRPRWSTTT